ncbi:MAG: LLM class flavin-dependent oxidoreductase [Crocinitomicaceae bacterium]|nr:LLM class flavin-dependent oxidoreductase [Crocinitomicaceae bacterium]|tara:strand:+ start:14120 stop:15127 length:1008 start_codon:yes stop_codon:yes gene_type:complete
MYPEKVKYSILELAPIQVDKSISEVYRNTLKLAQAADRLGYTRFWLAEHHNMKSIASAATSVLIGYVAGGTEKIRVGSGGIMLPNHSPLIVAEQFGTLANLYPNRIDLGLGRAPGTDQTTAHAIRSDRMQSVYRFPDEVTQIRQYFSPSNEGEKVRAYVAEGVEVPLYILGSSTDSAHVAARLGLPYVFASHFAPNQLLTALTIYREEFQPSAQLQEPYVVAGVNVVAADTDEEAERLSTSMIRMAISVMTGNIDFVYPPTDLSDDLRSLLQHPSFQGKFKYAFTGSKATVKEKVETFIEQTKVDELIVTTQIYGAEDRIRSYEILAEIMHEINA